MAINEQIAEQGWQQLQAHIAGFLGRALRTDVQRVEYEPRFISPPLLNPAERRRDSRERGQ